MLVQQQTMLQDRPPESRHPIASIPLPQCSFRGKPRHKQSACSPRKINSLRSVHRVQRISSAQQLVNSLNVLSTFFWQHIRSNNSRSKNDSTIVTKRHLNLRRPLELRSQATLIQRTTVRSRYRGSQLKTSSSEACVSSMAFVGGGHGANSDRWSMD